ncbi:hypothetical protein [Rhodococcus sp. AG1013]|uniref:hypothetical protein n=1 Tax=unclassified Rhodococcus (in: high G+C Gram-positive bacteria) TaxID=192944 RepID=UPI000E0C146F|nr:hypothetical protein [Rhodococcus sp. AG1013]RDI19905.1 hypothetical protein DEU38_11716 [Rhodococcus sp. AG1013]
MSSPSATLTVWAGSWLAGDSAPDDVIDALHQWAPMHIVGASDAATAQSAGLDWPGVQDGAGPLLLRIVRQGTAPAGAEVRLVLPAPGDVRGLPAGTGFARAALEAGEGVIVGETGHPGTGLVPVIEGPDVLRWTVFPIATVPPAADYTGLGEAEYAMREAIRGAADALLRLSSVQTGRADGDPRRRIAEALDDRAHHRYPDAIPTRALRILDSADQVATILAVAEDDSPTEAPSASSAAAREELLRPLWAAVRSARVAAVSACAGSAHRA